MTPKTIRAYLAGERTPGARRRVAPDPLEPFVDYLAARFADAPHLWASALYDEVSRLGYGLSSVSFARQLCTHQLRPHCEACQDEAGEQGPGRDRRRRCVGRSVPGDRRRQPIHLWP